MIEAMADLVPQSLFALEDSRRAECLDRHLARWSGLLQCDRYAAYRRLAETDRPSGAATLACCWSHLRREFFNLHVDGSSQVATWTVEWMAQLWAVEAKVKGQEPQTHLN